RKVAVITGAGSGIGRTTAERFANEGARVVVAEIDPAAGEETVSRIRERGLGDARFIQTDVTSEKSVAEMVSETLAAFGTIHILHNNAGGSTVRDGPVTEVPLEEWWRTI